MFGWLEKMLVKGPVLGSGCSCCEGKKEKLREMQTALSNAEAAPTEGEVQTFHSGSYRAEYTREALREEYGLPRDED